MPKSFFIDTSKCTACRGCQLACKEWNALDANATKQVGTHQNPPDLNANNYKLVRFNEHVIDGKVRWFFFPDQCRHCLTPPCKIVADSIKEGAITQDEKTGAVLFTAETKSLSKEDFESVRDSCPYNIPRRNEATGLMAKCTMCFERITSGMLPACVKVCPTGTMNFGEREAMLELANKRLAEVKKTFPRASLANPDDVSVIFLLQDDPKYYHSSAVAEAPAPLDRKAFLAKLVGPFGRLARELS
jgi:formate dehydrogenase iron-sulfur subunit